MMDFKLIKCVILTSALILSSTWTSTSIAAEHGALNYPAGSPGIFVGEFPPFPGLFLISQTSYTSSDALYDNYGDEIKDEDFSMDAWVQTFRFLASYPGQLWGAHLYSQLVVPLVNVETSLSVTTPYGPQEIFDDSDSGLGNLTVSPLIMSWTLPETYQHFTVGLDIALEQGASYDEDNAVNAGTGYSTIIPVLAYRLNNPDGLDIGAKANLMFNMKNDATNYDTGDMFALDFTAGWNFGKWKIGVVGGYTKQWEADTENGVDVDDSEMESLLIGPSIAYSAGPVTINFNYQKGLLAENTSMNDSIWLNIALPLYVPNPPVHK